MQEQPRSFDICILCALYEEASAVINEFETRCGVSFTRAFRGLNQLEYRHATIQNQRGEYLTVFVTWLSRMGAQRTALDLAPLLYEIRPRFVAMTGVCAGDRRKVKLGDLIVATDAYHPEEGKITTGSDGKPVHLPETRTASATTQVIQYVRGFDEWKVPVRELKRQQLKRAWRATDEPKCHVEVMASSMAVRADNPFPELTTQHNRKTVGIDMEAATFYTALRDFPLIHGLVVKGVSDYGDNTKTDRYRDYARRASAVYLLHFLQAYVTEETMPRRDALPPESRAGPLPFHGSLSPNVKSQYQSWLSANTATFHVPGPSGVSLPIDAAWSELHVLSGQEMAAQQDIEELLRRYHEWEVFASHADREGYNAKDVAEIGYRVVITGGPGAGKSTLCRKLAHDLTDLDEVVLWIDLPSLANRIQGRINITTALIDIATNGFDAPFEEREALLAEADCLIADGLDECGDLVVAVAEALQRWSTAHSFIRVVLTSRPIGYETTYFPKWEHYSLMPFTQSQVQSSSQRLIQALAPDATTVEKKVFRFQEQLEDNRVASLAARNPLLLGFLIQLSLQGEALAQQRADLYEQILNLWRVSLPQSRIWQVSQLDVLLAWRSLELIGWFLLLSEKGQKAYSHDQLVQQMSQQLMQEMDIRLLQASATASTCLQFWHERGVLDRIQIGDQAVYTFVHATFNEYAAGRYLARLSPSEIQQWVRSKYHDTRWREPILLTAGCGQVEVIARTLLEIDAEDEQATSVLLFAAAVLAESPTVPDTLTRLVINRLIARLTSTNPPLAYEVAEQGTSLVKKVPYLFVPLLQPLFAHHQIWTRLAATDLALASGSERVEIEILEQLLKDVMRDPISSMKPMKEEKEGKLNVKELREWILFPNDGWDVQNDVIVQGAEAIARMRPDTATKELLQALYLSSAISLNTKGKLSHILRDLGCQEFVEQHQVISEKAIKNWLNKGLRADQKMLETILRITHLPDSQPKKRRKLMALTTLIYALNVPESGVTQWDVLHRLDDITAIEAVLRGFIELYKINTKELALDTVWVLERIQDGLQNENVSVSLLQLLPRIPMELHVPVEINMNVSTQELFRALKHPSAIIAYGAGWLLVVGGRRAELEDLLQKMNQEINSNEQMKKIIVRMVPYIWENDVPLWLSNLLKGNEIIE